MTITYSQAVISDRLQALTRQLDSADTPGRMLIYSAPRPAGGQPPGAQAVLLGQVVFSKPSIDKVAGNELTIKPTQPSIVQSTGVAAWARIVNGAAVYVADMDVSADINSGAEVIIRKVDGTALESSKLYAGGAFSVAIGRHIEG